MAELVGDLSLDTRDAEDQLGELGDSLDSVTESFGAGITDALSNLQVSDVDTSDLESALSEAADSLSSNLHDVLDEAGSTGVELNVTADVGEAQGDIDGLAAEPIEVPVTADISDAQDAIDSLEGEDVSINVDADASGAESSLEELNDDATDAAGGLGKLNDTADQSTKSLGATGGAAATLGAGFTGAGSKALGASLGILTLGVGIGDLISQGVEAAGVMQRFKLITGSFGDEIQRINVGTLNRDLSQLAIDLGSDDEAALDAAASIFQFGKNSGVTGEAAAKVSEELLALAARAVALTPSLGDIGSVAEAMAQRLGKGGKAASRFGLDLRASEINEEAFRETGKTVSSELTIFEKTQAAATLAVKKYGNQLDESITQGSKNPIIQQRKLKEELNNVIEVAGKKLVPVFFDLMKASIPVVEQMTHLLADLGVTVLPPLSNALRLVAIPLQIVADVLDLVPDEILGAAAAFLVFQAAVGGVGAGLGKLSTGLGAAVSQNALRAGAALAGVAIGAQALNKVANPDTADGILDFAIAGAALGTAIEPGAGTAIGAVAGTMVALGTKAIAAGLGIHDLTDALKAEDAAAKSVAKGGVKDVSAAFDDLVKVVAKAATGTGATKLTNTLRAFRDVAEQNVGTAARLRQEFSSQPAVFKAMGNIIDQVAGKQRQFNEDQQVGQQIIASLGPTTAEVTAAVAKFGDSVASVGPTVAGAFDQAANAAANFGITLAEAPGAFGDALDNELTQALQFNSDLLTILGTGSEQLAAVLASKGQAAAGGFTHTLAEQIRAGDLGLTQSFETKAEQVAIAGKLLEQTGTEIGKRFVASVGGPLDNASLPALNNFFAGLGEQAAANAPLTQQQFEAVAAAAALGFSGPINTLDDTAGQALKDAGGAVDSGSPDVARSATTAGADASTGFGTGIEPLPGQAGTAVSNSGGAMAGAAGALAGSGGAAVNAGFLVGEAFAVGMAAGMASFVGTVVSAAVALVNAAEIAARSAADAHSPSRLFQKVGEDMGEGVIVGLEGQKASVAAAMADLIEPPNVVPLQLRAVVESDLSPALTLRGGTTAAAAGASTDNRRSVRVDQLVIHVDGSKVTTPREARRLGDVQGASVRRRVLETIKELT